MKVKEILDFNSMHVKNYYLKIHTCLDLNEAIKMLKLLNHLKLLLLKIHKKHKKTTKNYKIKNINSYKINCTHIKI